MTKTLECFNDGKRWLTLVFASILLASLGTILHNAFADTVTATIPVSGAYGITADPNTKMIYVATGNGYNIQVINGTTNTVTYDIQTKSPVPSPNSGGCHTDYVAVNPTTNLIYASNGGCQYEAGVMVPVNVPASVSVINGTTNNVITTVNIPNGRPTIAEPIMINPVTNKIYVIMYANGGGGVDVIDGKTYQVTNQIFTGPSPPYDLAVNPQTNMIYVLDGNAIHVINGTSDSLVSSFTWGNAGNYGIDVNPTTNRIYVSNSDSSISVIDGSTDKTIATIQNTAYGYVSVNPITNRIYVDSYGNSGNYVAIADGGTNNLVGTVQVGQSPYGIGINTNTNTIYVGNSGDRTVSVISGGSSSTSSAPQNLTVTPVSSSTIALSWGVPVNDGGSPIIGYKIERSKDNGSTWNTIVSNTNSTSTGYTDTGLQYRTAYTYRVSAINSVGASIPSNTATGTTFDIYPSSPTGLTAKAVSSSQINISWTAPSYGGTSPITGYQIERSTDNGSTWSVLIPNTGSTATAYNDTGLSPSTSYTYRVSAINSAGTSSASNTASATPNPAPSPTHVSITVNSVDLSSNPITGMSTVIRYTNGTTISDSFTPVSFTVKSGTTYVVHVRNYGSDVFNHWQDGSTNSYYTITPTQNVTLTAYYSTGTTTTTAPSAPQNLKATGGNSQVTLSWTTPSSNGGSAITNYKIYRSTSSGAETLLATTGNVLSYTDSTGTNGQTYFYKATALNSVGESAQSNEASATPSTPATAPGSPTGLAATTVSSSEINLSWTAPSNNGGSSITGYKIERSTDSGTSWSTIQSNAASTTTTYSDTGLNPSTSYMYRVSAINSVGTSSPSNTASATTSSAPPPTTTTQVTISVKSVNLSGNPITGMSVVIRYTNGTTISDTFTPASFTVTSGTTYVVHVRNYGTNVFNHWQDGTTNSYYTITPTQNVVLTAYYSTG